MLVFNLKLTNAIMVFILETPSPESSAPAMHRDLGTVFQPMGETQHLP